MQTITLPTRTRPRNRFRRRPGFLRALHIRYRIWRLEWENAREPEEFDKTIRQLEIDGLRARLRR